MNLRRIIPILGLAAIVIAAAGTHGFGQLGEKRETGLTLSGNVDIRQVDLGFRVGGRIADIPFDEGAHVSAGAVLARLDAATYQAAAATASAQVGVDQVELDKLRHGNRAQDIEQAQANLDQQQATLLQNKLDYDRAAILVRTSAVSQQTLDRARAQYQVGQGKAEAASAALSLTRAGARQEDIDAAAAPMRRRPPGDSE